MNLRRSYSPGEKGGAAEQVLFHDCAHILSGYGTMPGEEVQVAYFSAGFQRRDPWTFVFFVLLQFHERERDSLTR